MDKWDRDEIDISIADALKLAQDYIGGHWNEAAERDVALSVQKGGLSSRLYILQDSDGHRILVRLFGGKMVDQKHTAQDAIQAIFMFKLGQLQLSPKVLGVFDGGRLEEYIPSRPIVDDDLRESEIRKQIARKLARIHCVGRDFPISKQVFDMIASMRESFGLYEKEGVEQFEEYAKVAEFDPQWFVSRTQDWRKVVDWLSEVEPKVRGRVVFCHNDSNKLNYLIRETPDRFGEVVTLVDFEFCVMNYRAADLASHFNVYSSDLTKPDFKSGLDYPSADIRREYCEEYLNTVREWCTFEFDENGIDSLEHFLREVEFTSLMRMYNSVGWFLSPKKDKTVWEPIWAKNFSKAIQDWFKTFQLLREEFRSKYGM